MGRELKVVFIDSNGETRSLRGTVSTGVYPGFISIKRRNGELHVPSARVLAIENWDAYGAEDEARGGRAP